MNDLACYVAITASGIPQLQPVPEPDPHFNASNTHITPLMNPGMFDPTLSDNH